ncbi:hypothetical protein BGZ99_008637 [Dissophora globulifera]|uniref:Uncharacterized protein n=1 Tax=Dissophora globulifera TaxID=979702 RepID=A0A9P6RR67_9FUNG|nr:hypothetical protein BGZ99_008637 [Dissophora globulifera]
MPGSTNPSSSASSRGVYASISHDHPEQDQSQDWGLVQADGQSYSLQDYSSGATATRFTDHSDRIQIDDDADVSVVAFAAQSVHSDDDSSTDDDNDDGDRDLDDMSDIVPLAGSRRSNGYSKPSRSSSSPPSWRSNLPTVTSIMSDPFKILATVCGAAIIVLLAFGLLSLFDVNFSSAAGQTNAGDDSSSNNTEDNRVLKPPSGISVDDFNLSDFQLPPWDWDLNSYIPINITNGLKFTQIHWRNGEQYLAVDCLNQAPQYRYHFPSFLKDQFREHPTASLGIDDLLPLGEEPYVFVLCPPGIDNANIVFREFSLPKDIEDGSVPDAPPSHIKGTMQAPQPLLDDVVMLLVDAISRAKFKRAMTRVMATLTKANSTATTTGHRIFDFEHYNVLGQNSPPNKAFIYSGQSIENIRHEPKHWVWDVYEEQGFKTAHTDGECGGQQGILDYTTGAITSEYAHSNDRIPAQYQMPQTSWCENHDMSDHHHISFDDRLATLLEDLLIGRDGRPALLSPNSVLVIMSDHGLHYGRETYTFPGFIHHKIPPLFMAVPNQFLNARPDFLQALEQNQNRILSHMDLHQTFLHLAYGDMPVEQSNNGTQSYADYMIKFLADGMFRRLFHPTAPNGTSFAQEYGQSLLLPIDENRSCRSAGIPNDYCAFQPFLDLDPSKTVDATFLRGALLLLAKRMNDLTAFYRVNDVCHNSSLILEPLDLDVGLRDGTLESIGTADLVMESAFASAGTNRMPNPQQYQPPGHRQEAPETRIFYFMVRNRHHPDRKYFVTMQEDEMVMGKSDSLTIMQMSAYADSWYTCAQRISRGGKAIGKWQGVIKHFCDCL